MQVTRAGRDRRRRRALVDDDAAPLARLREPAGESGRVDAGAMRSEGPAEHARDPHLGLDLLGRDEADVASSVTPRARFASSPALTRASCGAVVAIRYAPDLHPAAVDLPRARDDSADPVDPVDHRALGSSHAIHARRAAVDVRLTRIPAETKPPLRPDAP